MKAFIITRCSICQPLTQKQWDKLMHIEDSSRRGWEKRYDSFIAKLERSGASDIEFNGHFGMNFYFSVERLTHVSRVVKKLFKLIGSQD